jgi:hypothetical protein
VLLAPNVGINWQFVSCLFKISAIISALKRIAMKKYSDEISNKMKEQIN